MAKVTVICGWCREEFETTNDKNKDGEFSVRICPNCGRTVRASKIELTKNVVGRKHWHYPSKTGDIV